MSVTRTQAEALREVGRRRTEAFRLFRPDERELECLQCPTREVLIRGGNRSGKSVTAAVRFAAIAMDRPIVTAEGKEVHLRLPHQRGKPLVMWVIGYQLNHIGQTIHRLLFRAGLFAMIKDQQTRQWRAYREWEPEDRERRHLVKPAPPLIPPRYINPKGWSWENKSEREFTKVEIWDPQTHAPLAEIYAFASSAEVKQGDPVDEIWIDEAIKFAGHYPEWQARIIDRQGRICWSSWPRMSNDALLRLSDRCAADAEEDGVQKTAQEFVFTMSGNPHISDEAKEAALAGWSEDERRARDLGHFLTDNLLIYPTFNRNIHTALQPDPKDDDDLAEVLRKTNGVPPHDWTRYLILDPGTTKPGVVLAAVPPPVLGDYVVPYDEVYGQRMDAEQLADRVLAKVQGFVFEQFIIDYRAARMTPAGMGITVGSNYSKAFEKRNIRSNQTGTGFTFGSDDILGRWGLVHAWLALRPNGFPKLRIVTERCPELTRQFQTIVKKTVEGIPQEKPAKQKDDLAVCIEYLASRNPQYVPPAQSKLAGSEAYRHFRALFKRRADRRRDESRGIHAGPGEVA